MNKEIPSVSLPYYAPIDARFTVSSCIDGRYYIKDDLYPNLPLDELVSSVSEQNARSVCAILNKSRRKQYEN